MRKFKQLTAADRRVIETLLKRQCTNLEIARELGVDPATVSREITKRSTPAGYLADVAQTDYEAKRKKSRKRQKLYDPKTQTYVLGKLKLGWSVDAIRGQIKLGEDPETKGLVYACNETIYAWIYKDPYCVKESVYQYLKLGKKRRSKHHGRKSQRQLIPNKVSIHQRPEIVEKRVEFGHWEGDSVIYRDKQAINTLNELYAGLVVFTKLDRKTAQLTADAMINRLSKHTTKTLTLDNGCEFVEHERVTKDTGVDIYFCDPYSSYQRGSNENTNGLLRRYLPKRSSLKDVTQEDLDDIAWELNHRPRKRLGYLSPIEFYERNVLNLQKGETSCI